jgi:hypothetical protein
VEPVVGGVAFWRGRTAIQGTLEEGGFRTIWELSEVVKRLPAEVTVNRRRG